MTSPGSVHAVLRTINRIAAEELASAEGRAPWYGPGVNRVASRGSNARSSPEASWIPWWSAAAVISNSSSSSHDTRSNHPTWTGCRRSRQTIWSKPVNDSQTPPLLPLRRRFPDSHCCCCNSSRRHSRARSLVASAWGSFQPEARPCSKWSKCFSEQAAVVHPTAEKMLATRSQLVSTEASATDSCVVLTSR